MRLMLGSAVFAITLLVTTSTLALAGDDGTGIIVSRLELRGPVASTDSFMIFRSSSEPGAIIEPGEWVCGPDGFFGADSICTAGIYEIETPPLPVGSTVDYEFRHSATSGADYTAYCEGSITVQEQPQTVTCVYDYALGSTPLLPDTAMDAPASDPRPLLGLLAGTISVWLFTIRRRRSGMDASDL